ncbi:MAG: hypothetical protein VYC34_11070, partial [Planctomycetota bacterium]|nr:hypothetical protein [Planctomycetota bacterium]
MSVGLKNYGQPRTGREARNRLFVALCIAVAGVTVSTLLVLLGAIAVQGIPGLWGLNREAYAERLDEYRAEQSWILIDQRLAAAAP